jgi:guanylate kinase
MQQGNIFVISAPSGAGKSSLVKALCEKDNKIQVSISHTTRKMRPGDIHGVHYFFVNHNEFEEILTQNKFLEHAKVYDNFYGTHIDSIKRLQANGQDIILEIDNQGASQVKHIFPNAILIYILPPNLDELKKRLINRNTDSNETIEKRLSQAQKDISLAKEFDYIVINDNFATALDELYSIIMVSRMKANTVLETYKF